MYWGRDTLDTDRGSDELVRQVESIAATAGAAAQRETVTEILATGVLDPVLAPTTNLAHPSETFCDALTAIARHSVELAEAVQVQALCANTIRRHATASLWSELGPGMREGRSLAVSCLSERNSGSDLSAVELSAVREGDTYRLNGHKNWVAHAVAASELIVYARTRDAGIGGITAFVVPANAPGVEVSEPSAHLQGIAIPVSSIGFRDVAVPADRILGRRDRGGLVTDILSTQGRLGLAACAIGVGTAALERALRFAKSHRRFGQPIIEYQSVGFTLADMATGLRAAQQLLSHACATFDRDPAGATLVCAQAKLFATDTAARVTGEAVEILGASAYLPGERVEMWMRQAKLLQTLQGTNRIQRLTIAARLDAAVAAHRGE
ncbi:acyl-CoA dehydrogenase family protein [Nocardia goodfellowii]|uniref:Alkylation response protein AidB-like acyl-CoA dehydrogenase n=1 Tax=Nocardia goodfellowii TaxID=882446 RepID=A0ABS4QMY2_9NOCA|nr:acyl-CoA dehydrogenase family protein [Nocardia goodfellowii]MBP2193066.1 alkylation response protein AidB-like acyl-CoA dehydrogenase [Nocardia goodfellowii]